MRLSILLLLYIGSLQAIGQTSMNAGNGEVSNNFGNISYSIGQTFYVGQTNSAGSVFPGVQQTYEILPVGTLNPKVSLEVKVYPNPATDYFILSFSDDTDISGFSARITDSTGKIIQVLDIREASTRIEASSYPAGVYLLYVLDKQRVYQTFKIIKK